MSFVRSSPVGSSSISSSVGSAAVQRPVLVGAEAALEQLGEGVMIVAASGEISYLNSQALGYFGRDRQDLEGRIFWDCFPRLQAEQSEFYGACQRSLQEQIPLELESRSLYAGEILWIRLVPHHNGLMIYLRALSKEPWLGHQRLQYDAREALLSGIAQKVQRFAPLDEILQTAVEELWPLLRADRVLLYRIQNWKQVHLVTQSVAPDWPLDAEDERCVTWVMNSLQDWHEESYYPVADVEEDDLTATEQRLLRQLRVKAQLVMPIFLEQELWGLLVVQQCTGPRQWQPSDIDLLKKVVTQMTVALQQNELRAQVDHLNVDLDTQVQERTTQLQKALDWEAMLKRITDKVRDSLDENQILQKAVQELALVMGMGACNAALYDLERQTSTIYYEYVTTLPTSQGRVAKMSNYPEIYNQLLQAQHFQFCSITPSPVRGRVAMLACPIFDNEGVLGDLWLVNYEDYAFSDREIRLVQQAANQCAIALRQARLYQAAQAQVAELEKINRLKDEFLSTVSHELRTPMTNMKMGILMLDVALKRRQDELQTELPHLMLIQGKVAHYLEILRNECERESQLINDLLDLQRLDADTQDLDLKPILLQDWLPPLVGIFTERASDRQQTLTLDVPHNLPTVITHVPGLERIVAELLNNACKYTPSDCEIRIQARQVRRNLELTVTNTGVEIPAAELERVFDKFYRVPSNDPWKQGGTGLGLALVKKLSQHLGGDVEICSGDGQTSFRVELPFEPALSHGL
ncbi:MAG: GAF domain-containing protein [Synechococcales cyanobacterium CRU_2_2]|nr:GAF domain-containing protein [Synechococcales cyanobacterium CRU_2_2]